MIAVATNYSCLWAIFTLVKTKFCLIKIKWPLLRKLDGTAGEISF